MSITVCTVSGKGGTGKSTVSSGIAIAAASKNQRVLLIDLDAGLGCLDIIFGIDDEVVFRLDDAICAEDISKALYNAKYYENISVIPAPGKADAIDFQKLSALVERIKNLYDLIILDFPAGTDFEAYNRFDNAVFLIVTGADDVSVKAAAAISSGLKADIKARLIINRFDMDMMTAGFYNNIDGVIDASNTRLIGIVPADGELLLLSRNHKIKQKGRPFRAFDRIIRRISGEDVSLPVFKKI